MAAMYLIILGELKIVKEVKEVVINLIKEFTYITNVACPKRKRN